MKIKIAAVIFCIAVFSGINAYAQESEFTIKLNGEKIDMAKEPVMIDNRLLLPLRTVFDSLDAVIDWNGETKTVTATKNDIKIEISANSDVMYRNGEEIKLDVSAKIIDEAMYLPVRAVSEAFDYEVLWNGEAKIVDINSLKETQEIIQEESKTEASEKNLNEITYKEEKNEVKASDGTLILTGSFKYPILGNDNNSEIINNFNTLMLEGKDVISDTGEYAEDAKELHEYRKNVENDTTFNAYEFSIEKNVTYYDGKIISVLESGYEYTGGAHPNSYQAGVTMDLTTGTKLKLCDALKMSQEDTDKLIIDIFTKKINENQEAYFDEAIQELSENTQYIDFYLKDDKIIVFFNEYILGPHSLGIVEHEIDINELVCP